VKQAQTILLDAVQPLEIERIEIRSARGRILAEALHAAFDMPLFTNSSADGFAVQAGDTALASLDAPAELVVVADIPAGSEPVVAIRQGQAARIMTGAPLPQGADAVVMVEATDHDRCDADLQVPKRVRIHSPVKPGDSIRPRGQDVQSGAVLFSAGHALRPQDIGLLASQGFATVPVFRRPRIALLSSGDELLDPSQPLSPGKIYDANSYMLAALLEDIGAEVVSAGFVRDDEDAVRNKLDELTAANVDLLVTSAGVSVGAFDFIRKVIIQNGNLTFWKVDMRPGKPLAFGNYRGVPIVGLPGNPVSAFVGCLVFIAPMLMKMSGIVELHQRMLQAKLLEPVESDGRESYLRAILEFQDGNPVVRLSGHQGSANLYALTRANALLILPSGVKSLPAGFNVNIYPLLDGKITGYT
jgi:molybdopterin molybdotransferase